MNPQLELSGLGKMIEGPLLFPLHSLHVLPDNDHPIDPLLPLLYKLHNRTAQGWLLLPCFLGHVK